MKQVTIYRLYYNLFKFLFFQKDSQSKLRTTPCETNHNMRNLRHYFLLNLNSNKKKRKDEAPMNSQPVICMKKTNKGICKR